MKIYFIINVKPNDPLCPISGKTTDLHECLCCHLSGNPNVSTYDFLIKCNYEKKKGPWHSESLNNMV